MKAAMAVMAAGALAGCAVPPATTRALPGVALVNPSFEAPAVTQGGCPSGWYCSTHAGATSHRYRLDLAGAPDGRAAFCADRLEKENWALLNQYVPADALRGARVRLSMSMRVDAAATAPGAGPFLLSEALDASAGLHEQKLVAKTAGWQRLAVEGIVPAKAWRLQVGVLFDADGPACVDDVRLEVVSPG
jgi:hypothetical protein